MIRDRHYNKAIVTALVMKVLNVLLDCRQGCTCPLHYCWLPIQVCNFQLN